MGAAARPPTILIVDDEAAVRRSMRRDLLVLGAEFLEAPNGFEGLQLAAAHKPDVILLDLHMPEMDGHTFLRRVRRVSRNSQVVVVTAKGDKEDVIEVLRGGAMDFVSKPWAPEELVVAVTRGLQAAASRSSATAVEPTPALAEPVNLVTPTQRQVVERPTADLTEILRDFSAGTVTLPAAQGLVIKLRRLIADSKTNILDLAAVIACDQSVATSVLRFANAANRSRGKPCTEIVDAVSRIGFRTIDGIVQTIIARNCFRIRDPELRANGQTIWQLGVARAVAARAIAVRAQLDPDTMYLAGLLADCGALFLYWMLSEKYNGKVPFAPEASASFVFKHHSEIGAQILETWEFPPAVVQCARLHHAQSDPAGDPAADLILLAMQIARDVADKEDVTGPRPESSLAIDNACFRIGLQVDELRLIVGEVRPEYEAIRSSLE